MTTLSLTLFGSFRAALDSQPVARFESNKVRALLAYLAVEADRAHSRDELIGLLWPDLPDTAARTNLRQALANLRLALNDREPQAIFISNISDGIQFLYSSDHTIDVTMFEALIAECKTHAHRRLATCRSCVSRLQQAVELYRDDFLAHFLQSGSAAFEEWVLVRREHWHQAALEALYYLAQHHELRGDYEQALQYARRQLELDAWREEAHCQAMRALALSGQRSAALAQFETCRRILKQELSAEPARETTVLAEQIKADDLTVEQRQYNLPTTLTPLIGREAELVQIQEQLANHRLVTLTGSGGVGKTRLAVQAGYESVQDYQQGVWLIELAPLADPALVPNSVITMFDLPEDAARSPLTVLTDYLREKTLLLMLDNCEHLIEACAQLAEHLSLHCPDVCILATSREALGIDGEVALRVPSLSLPPIDVTTHEACAQAEAVQLFVERAAAALPGFVFTDANAPLIAQICRRLDGIALAIELAASRVKVLSIEQIADRLDDAFRLLTGGRRTALPRQQTLRATIDWSYDLLAEAERIVLRRLAVFVGGATLEAVDAVCSGDGLDAHEGLDLVTQLVNKSLVVVEREQGVETRYTLLETVRQYAREKLSESGEADAIRSQHLTFFRDLARRAEPEMQGARQLLWLDRLEVEINNLRAALKWSLEDAEAHADMGLRLASHLWWFWFIRDYSDGGEWLEKTLLASQASVDQVTRATALARLGWVSFFDATHAEEGLTLGRTLGPVGRESVALALLGKGAWAFYQADYAQAKSLLEESLGFFQEAGYRFGICESLTWLGMALINLGDYQQAKDRLEESLALARKAQDANEIGFAVWQLGRAAMFQGDYAQAATLMQESLAIYREIKQMGGVTFLLNDLGKAALLKGDHQQAVLYFRESLSLYWKSGYVRNIASGLEQVASIAVVDRQSERAATLLGAAQALRESSGADLYPYQRAEYEQSLESLHSQLDEATLAAQWGAGRVMTMKQAIKMALSDED